MTLSTKQLAERLASRTGLDARFLESFVSATASAIVTHCADLDTVAFPGFGNFSSEKHDEKIEIDSATGKRMLLPPHIDMVFRQSVVLKKRLGNE